MAQLKSRLREGHPVDIADIILRFTLNNATSFLFNHDLHCLDAGLPYRHYVSDTACTRPMPSRRLSTRCRLRFWANKLDGLMGVVHAFLDPIPREAVAKKGEEKNKMRNRETAALITFVSYMLTEHPNVMEKLRSEILRVELKYLQKRSVSIPLFSQFVMHCRTDLWGPDALEFDPECFLDERLYKYLVPNLFMFMPFNAGQRICLGQQFAYHEASFFVVRLLQTFSSIALAPDAQPPPSRKTHDPVGWKAYEKIRPRSHFTMYGGLWVTIDEAATAEEETDV
ncbi:cytochrome P450 [Mycena leptocephala]|nr:cytochrome P450 [Mycena leptocephala]